MAVAFDTRRLQSNIRRVSDVPSTTSLGTACGRTDLDSEFFETLGMRIADGAFSIGGKREAHEKRGHHNLGAR
jgi:hypothetical protein